MQVNRRLGGKKRYWQDADALWEMLTVSYARADSPPLPRAPVLTSCHASTRHI